VEPRLNLGKVKIKLTLSCPVSPVTWYKVLLHVLPRYLKGKGLDDDDDDHTLPYFP